MGGDLIAGFGIDEFGEVEAQGFSAMDEALPDEGGEGM